MIVFGVVDWLDVEAIFGTDVRVGARVLHDPVPVTGVSVTTMGGFQVHVEIILQLASIEICSHVQISIFLTVSAEVMMVSINTKMNYFIIKLMEFNQICEYF